MESFSVFLVPIAVVCLSAIIIGLGLGGAMSQREIARMRTKFENLNRSISINEQSLQSIEMLTDKLDKAQISLEQFFQLSIDLCCVSNKTHLFMVNEAWVEHTCYSRDELLERPWSELIHPEDIDNVTMAIMSMEQADLIDFTNRIRCRNGKYITVEWRASQWENGVSSSIGRVRESA